MRKTLLISILVIFIVKLSAQNNMTLITGKYHNVKFEEFVKDVESKVNVKFYFLEEWVGDIIVNFTCEGLPIDIVLKQVLKDTELYFYIDKSKNVIITKRYKIADKFIDVSGKNESELLDDLNQNRSEPDLNKKLEFQLINIGLKNGSKQGNIATISGYIRALDSNEPINGAVAYVEGLNKGTSTNQKGFYSLNLPLGEYKILFRSVGWADTYRQINLLSNGKLNIKLEEELTPIEEILVSARKNENLEREQIGLEKISMKSVKLIPASIGEADVLKTALTLPGVQSVGEGSAGINVRGGAADQNLILLYDVPFFNSSHFFGFFSNFNTDIVKDVSLYKGGIPAKYGGRSSSVIDVLTKDGNMNKYSGNGGVSPISARLSFEGPIISNKASFLIAGRATYSNWILGLIEDPEIKNSKAGFYDLNARLVYDVNDNNKLELSAYVGHDDFRFSQDTTYNYNSYLMSLKWQNNIKKRLYSVFSANISKYDYSISSESVPENSFIFEHNVNYLSLKADFTFSTGLMHKFAFGVNGGFYEINPGKKEPYNNLSLVSSDVVQKERAIEISAYFEDNIQLFDKLSLTLGFRFSAYSNLGERNVFVYDENYEKTKSGILDTVFYEKGEPVSKYFGPEYRASINYRLTPNSSIKFNFNRLHQYVHMLSNSVSVAPTAIWKLSDSYIKPQVGDQFAVGYYLNINNSMYQTSLEVYYKSLFNMIDYKGGAQILLNHEIEASLTEGDGKAYGAEFMIKKTRGKFNGFFNYTYSRTFIQSDGKFPNEIINGGEYYPASYDKPHALNLVMNYQYSRRFTASTNFTYSTGRPITFPVAVYNFDGKIITEYSERNKYRIPDYFRLDLSLTFDGNLKKDKLMHSTWTFAIYNVLGRRNAYSVFFKNEENSIKSYKLSVFARPIPTITYNFKF